MDEDFYIEENSTVKIILIFVVLIALGVGVFYAYNKMYKPNYVKLKKVTVELGDILNKDIKNYIECDDYSKYTLDLGNVLVDSEGKTTSAGEYSYKISGNNTTKKGKLFVKDTTAPNAEVKDLTVGVNEAYEVADFVISCDDLSMPCHITYKNKSDINLNKSSGEYTLTIVIADNAGNETTKDVKLIVKEGYSYQEEKEKDLEYSYTSNEEANWNQTYTLKFDKAISDEDVKFDDALKTLSAKEYQIDGTIKDKEIIIIYNKYDYVVGLSIKVTLEDGKVIFITNENEQIIEESE